MIWRRPVARKSISYLGAIVISLLQTNICLAASVDPSIMNMPSQGNPQVGSISLLSAVFDESLINSPRAANIRAQLGISKAAYAQALTLPNPSFFFLNDTAQLARQIGASIPIEPPWKLAFRLLLAKSQVKQADFEIQRNLWQLRSTVRRAYLDVVMATETTETFDELHKLSSDLLTVAQRRFEADDVPEFDVRRAELATLQAEADLKQSEKKHEQAKQRLSVLMGRDYKSSVQVQRLPVFQLRIEDNELLPDFTKQIPVLDSLIADALTSRLDIKVVRQSIAVNEANRRSVVGNIFSNPQLNIGSSYSGNPPDGPATRGYFIGVTQEIPVLNFQQGDRARLSELSAARECVQYFQDKILLASAKVARMDKRGYDVGQTDITTTLAAQQANVQTKAGYLDVVRSYQQALTDLEQAIGHPL